MLTPLVQNNMLYHYCRFETALKILSKKRLRLSRLVHTNDPRENKPLPFGISSQSRTSLPVNEVVETGKTVSHLVREDCKVICFSTDKEPVRGYELDSMWAHYAERHHGICIGINYQKFIQENSAYVEKSMLRHVTYIPRTSLLQKNITELQPFVDIDRYGNETERTQYLKEFRQKHADHLYFTKSESWEGEQEFRLLYFGDPTKEEYCSISESLMQVFLGLDFDMENLPQLIAAVNSEQCMIWEMDYGGSWVHCKQNLNERMTSQP